MWRAALLALALIGPAQAQVQNPSLAGYQYPSAAAGGSCSPACTGVRALVKVPPIGTPAGNYYLGPWIGISDVSGTGSCTAGAGCLGQIGIFGNGSGFEAWQELAPNYALTPVTLTVSAGDVISLSMQCATNCTPGVASQTWTINENNQTTGQTFSTTLNWPLAQVRVYAVMEPQLTVSNFGIARISNLQVQQSGVWTTVPLTTANALWIPFTNSDSTQVSLNPSGPVGGGFNICYSSGSTSVYVPCPSGPLQGGLFGPQ